MVGQPVLDAKVVLRWCRLRSPGWPRHEEIDALNVYPVPDGDTGTNLYLTLSRRPRRPNGRIARMPHWVRSWLPARGALLGAGNSG